MKHFELHPLFGVEHEFFVFDGSALPPTAQAIEQLWEEIASRLCGQLMYDRQGNLFGLRINSKHGPVVLANDGCSHVLEIAFPPMRSLLSFEDCFNSIWSTTVDCLSNLGLHITPSGILERPVQTIHWRHKPTDANGDRLTAIRNRPSNQHGLFLPDFVACTVSTQISLGISSPAAKQIMPVFWAFEFLIPLRFSQSHVFLGQHSPSMRQVAYQANFGHLVTLVGEESAMHDKSASCSAWSGKRNYAFIALRDGIRVEFRTACAQPTLERILDLIRFRLAVYDAAVDQVNPKWDAQHVFWDACEGQSEAAADAMRLLDRYLDHAGLSETLNQLAKKN